MDDDAATQRHTRAVAFVRWRIAAEKFDALGRAAADQATLAQELSRAGDEVSRRYAEWRSTVPAELGGPAEPGGR